MRQRQPNVSKTDNRERRIACQIIIAIFFFMFMLHLEGLILTGILDLCYAGFIEAGGNISKRK